MRCSPRRDATAVLAAVAVLAWCAPARGEPAEPAPTGAVVAPGGTWLSLALEGHRVASYTSYEPYVGVLSMNGQIALTPWLALDGRLPLALGVGSDEQGLVYLDTELGLRATKPGTSSQVGAGITLSAPTGALSVDSHGDGFVPTRVLLYQGRAFDDPARYLIGAWGASLHGEALAWRGRWATDAVFSLAVLDTDRDDRRALDIHDDYDLPPAWLFATAELGVSGRIGAGWSASLALTSVVDLNEGRPGRMSFGQGAGFAEDTEFRLPERVSRSVRAGATYRGGGYRVALTVTVPLDPHVGTESDIGQYGSRWTISSMLRVARAL